MRNRLLFLCFILFFSFFSYELLFKAEEVYGASCSNPGKGNENSPYYDSSNDLGLHPTLKNASEKIVSEAKSKLNLEITIGEGFRSKEYQDYLYSQGRTCGGSIVTNASGGDGSSYHMYGLAFDFIFVDGAYDTTKDRNKNGKDDWKEVGELGESYGLEWGGKWKDFVDLPHFQYTYGLSTSDLKGGKLPPEGAEIKLGGSTGSDVKSDILNIEAYEFISKFSDYKVEIDNIGINTKEQSDSSTQSIKVNKASSIVLYIFNTLCWTLGILAFGYVSILWLSVLLARTKFEPAYLLVSKLTLEKIDAYEDLGKMIKLTIVLFIIIGIALSGLIPMVFALIYKVLSLFISGVFRL